MFFSICFRAVGYALFLLFLSLAEYVRNFPAMVADLRRCVLSSSNSCILDMLLFSLFPSWDPCACRSCVFSVLMRISFPSARSPFLPLCSDVFLFVLFLFSLCFPSSLFVRPVLVFYRTSSSSFLVHLLIRPFSFGDLSYFLACLVHDTSSSFSALPHSLFFSLSRLCGPILFSLWKVHGFLFSRFHPRLGPPHFANPHICLPSSSCLSRIAIFDCGFGLRSQVPPSICFGVILVFSIFLIFVFPPYLLLRLRCLVPGASDVLVWGFVFVHYFFPPRPCCCLCSVLFYHVLVPGLYFLSHVAASVLVLGFVFALRFFFSHFLEAAVLFCRRFVLCRRRLVPGSASVPVYGLVVTHRFSSSDFALLPAHFAHVMF